VSVNACGAPSGYVSNNTDCNDTGVDAAIEFPGQEWFFDVDADGYGDANSTSQISCLRPTNKYISAELAAEDTDCEDSDA
jgi:hypothetical protein